ncbi:hypothetical protein JOB18_001405 [Solea senegalensis]|uniref:Uncharacterized protein n=1 Tax=Solea senegalensis TaxID=28829 RepID=A0AAV6RW52_SOLSE|nr:hypothetical protein JOB18_001405 [Solea senegalensis]
MLGKSKQDKSEGQMLCSPITTDKELLNNTLSVVRHIQKNIGTAQQNLININAVKAGVCHLTVMHNALWTHSAHISSRNYSRRAGRLLFNPRFLKADRCHTIVVWNSSEEFTIDLFL